MTDTLPRETDELDAARAGDVAGVAAGATPSPEGAPPVGDGTEGAANVEIAVERVELRLYARPLLASALSAGASGLVAGGIFGVWSARIIAFAAAVFGAGWAALALRRPKRAATVQVLLVPVAAILGILSVIPASDGAANDLPTLLTKAVQSGRLLRPPVPFDPGWRPILIVLFAVVGFGAAWTATALDRAKAGVALPLAILGLTAITQPAEGEFIAGLCAFIPLLIALAVLFGGDGSRSTDLDTQFELKRALRGLLAIVPMIAAIVLLNNASFLFPKPVYNPADKPQKPKALPISQAVDRVLFEVRTASTVTGPWRAGVLDVYDGRAWRLPPFDKQRFRPLPADGVIDAHLAPSSSVTVEFAVRDLGDSGVLPGLSTPAVMHITGRSDLVFDPRAGVARVPQGRVPAGVTYSISMPPYPEGSALGTSPAADSRRFAEYLDVPSAPRAVQELLAQAPTTPWARLDFLRTKLREVVVSTGGGTPVDVPPSKVDDLLDGSHEGSPYEIVATEALLARWAGVPSRIGFGFDGVNDEQGVLTVRPKNSAQWLEVYFEGHGWIPLIGAPPKAKAELDTDPNARFNPTIEPSDEVAVELYLAYERQSLSQLYTTVRSYLFQALPWLVAGFVLWLIWPPSQKQWRRIKRRRWAEGLGARARVAVEYAEFRDLALDLNVGNPLASAIEFLDELEEDDEHQELAWLVSRAMYDDLGSNLVAADVVAAEELAHSMRRRLFRAQPLQSRLLALISRTSLYAPYTSEVPNVRQLGVGAAIRRRLGGMRERRIEQKRRRRLTRGAGLRSRLLPVRRST